MPMRCLLLLFQAHCLHLLLFQFLPFSFSLASFCHPNQSSSLLQFKSSSTGDAAGYASLACHQTYPKTTSWENGTDCCSWLGVTCDNISGHVIGLDLSCSRLQGKIHPNSTLFRLTHLQRLNLAFNNFSQSQLSTHFGGFVSLTHLNLSESNFEGEIPLEISQLSKLVSLDLSGNSFLESKQIGTWKRLLQNATFLRELVLDGTNMSLIMPSSFFMQLNLSSSLVTLSLKYAQMRGNLESIICPPNLKELHISNNDFQGQLPNLNCSTSLKTLDLSYCQFQRSIPPSFSNLTDLTYLSLSVNSLNGSIPSSILTLPHLSFLDLSSNKLSGPIPSSLSKLHDLTELDLSSNKLSGEIPDVFGGLTKLETLELWNNTLRGKLPSSLFELTQLFYLDCRSNRIEDSLPNKITGFSNLSYLYLDNNFMNGTIPSWLLSLPSLIDLYLSNNQFTGHIGEISSYSLVSLSLCHNNLEGNIPHSIFNLANLTYLCISSNTTSSLFNFQLFSKFQNLQFLSLSGLSISFETNATYSFPRLQTLQLSSCNLTEFPNLSSTIPNLSYLDLSQNKLQGRVPQSLHKIDSISYLNLSRNMLTSMDEFSWYELRYLDLSSNLMGGEISSSICNAQSLWVINLSNNNFTGIIPPCLAKIRLLQVLDLHQNKIYGNLPNTLPTFSLITLSLSDNQLVGPLPESLSNCTQLEVLNLGNNQIEDTFPHWLRNLSNLRVLVLRSNRFHGQITKLESKNHFPNLIIFDISSNDFSGPLPAHYIENFKAMMNVAEAESSLHYLEFTYTSPYIYPSLYDDSVVVTLKGVNMMLMKIPTIFAAIDLSQNNFEGEIPSVIAELHALKGLNLSHNRLTGPIPQSIGNLASLESLDLSSNMLTGEIPTELTNLNYLEVLNLSRNHLVGPIPRGKQFDTFLNDSYLENLGLCGFPVSISCNKDPDEGSSSSLNFNRGQEFKFGWKPVVIGYGSGIIVGVGIGYCVLFLGMPQGLARWLEVRLIRG